MRIENLSDYPDQTIRPLLRFGAKGIRDAGVLVVVKNDDRMHGRCDRIDLVVELWLPPYRKRHQHAKEWYNPYRLKRVAQRWPNGFPFDTWHDCAVYMIAHEFRHAKQGRDNWKREAEGKPRRRRCEHDAELWGLRTLNKWRELTGRPIIPEHKQPNPFAKA